MSRSDLDSALDHMLTMGWHLALELCVMMEACLRGVSNKLYNSCNHIVGNILISDSPMEGLTVQLEYFDYSVLKSHAHRICINGFNYKAWHSDTNYQCDENRQPFCRVKEK